MKTLNCLTNKQLNDLIASYCPNMNLPRKRSLKLLVAKDIKWLIKKMPMSIPHPEKEGELMTISIDTFMQGEKI